MVNVIEKAITQETRPVASRSNPYVFVVGCPRSGTTLLQRMLDHHPQLAVAYDTHFIPSVIKELAPGANPILTPEIVEDVRNFERFDRLGLPEESVDRAVRKSRTYSEFVSALYSELARLHDKPLAGEKSPGYAKFIPSLHALFPEAKIVHIIRDGRDVALSLRDWARNKNKGPARRPGLWQDETIAACALWWADRVEKGRHHGKKLGHSLYYELQYEELVARPEANLRGLAHFLDLPYAPEMLAYHVGKMNNKSGRSAKASWLPPTSGLRDWRTEMDERDIELFEALAGDVLTAAKYQRHTTTISPEIAPKVEYCLEWWRREREIQKSSGLYQVESHIGDDRTSTGSLKTKLQAASSAENQRGRRR